MLLEDDMTLASKWLNLQTGEVRPMSRCLRDLLFYGWKVVEGQEHLDLVKLRVRA